MKPKTRSCFILTAFVLGMAILCCGAISVFLTNSHFKCFGTPFPSLTNVEEQAYLRFPPSAQNIEFFTNAVNRKAGCTIWVTFEMDSNDLEAFASTIQVDQLSPTTQLSGDGFTFLSQRQGWYQTTPSLAGHGRSPGLDEDQWVFIDTSDPERWTVYLITNKEWL
jgi:hypothetical protein